MDFKKFFEKEPIKRATRTFVQAAIGYFAINVAFIDFSNGREAIKSTLVGLLVASVSAGMAAVMNLNKDTESEG